jgi:hypothetical protein
MTTTVATATRTTAATRARARRRLATANKRREESEGRKKNAHRGGRRTEPARGRREVAGFAWSSPEPIGRGTVALVVSRGSPLRLAAGDGVVDVGGGDGQVG